MLDFFTIFSKSGLVLWYYAFQDVKGNFTDPVNAFIKSVILQERGGSAAFVHGTVQMKYMQDNEFELIFVVGYQKILTLSYVDKLIDDVHRSFRDRYRQQLLDGTLAMLTADFDFKSTFAHLLKNAEHVPVQPKQMKGFSESKKSQKTIESLKIKKKEPAPKKNDRRNSEIEKPKAAEVIEPPKEVVNPDEMARRIEEFKRKKTPKATKTEKKPKKGKTGKQMRKWDQGGSAKDAVDLDYSNPNETSTSSTNGYNGRINGITEEERGWIQGSQHIQDLVVENDSEAETAASPDVAYTNTRKKSSGIFSMFSNLVGSKALSKDDLASVLKTMREHLIGKNVAAEIAEKMCESVSAKLEGKVLGTFETIASTVKQSLQESLVQILTPKRRVDILRDVLEAQRVSRPYVITFCGVNGVGKSTNLAKISFWLMKNGFRVLIAACDTFRAGAVEQLRTHEARLNSLYQPEGDQPKCRLYEKGYGKDAAHIAMQAINAAKEQGYDIVMIDTAGRMQDNEPLMRSLSKLVTVNTPDLVLFVGEALVGNEAVDQLQKFNQALADHSNMVNPHCIDGIVLTKFDTIDDKVGAAISMTYTTGQPIVFVGTGQSYPDLRSLNPKAVVNALLK